MDTATPDGKIRKMEVDYSATVNEKLPIAETLVKDGKLNDALEMLLSLEKQARTASDAHSTSRLLVAVVKLCYEAGRLDLLRENLVSLSKKRGQIRQAIQKMVQATCEFVEKVSDQELKLQLIDTIRQVTAGKIYVEVERARLTRTLAQIREAEGKIEEALDLLQELQIETCGSMDKKEKCEFLLEQMRLANMRRDFTKLQIVSRKIAQRFLSEPGMQELHLNYHSLMIELALHDASYLNACRHYRALQESELVKADAKRLTATFKCQAIYVVLAPFDAEQTDMLLRIKQEKAIEELPIFKRLLELFRTLELINWREFCAAYEAELRHGASDGLACGVFAQTEDGEKRWKDLRIRVAEHNIRVMAKWYTRITLKRMAELLELEATETVDFLSKLVCNKTIQAKIDGLDGVVNFEPPRNSHDLLTEWIENASTLMGLLNEATHLINKERMVHEAGASVASID